MNRACVTEYNQDRKEIRQQKLKEDNPSMKRNVTHFVLVRRYGWAENRHLNFPKLQLNHTTDTDNILVKIKTYGINSQAGVISESTMLYW